MAEAGHGVPPGMAHMKKHVWAVCLGVAAVLAGTAALATGTGEAGPPAEEPDDALVLGEEDLADRAEILRNMYRRITPPDMALVQDVGTWPAAWEEFGAEWDAAAAEREYGAWVVPVEVTQDAGATVVCDGNGAVLWRGWTDFARPESADVVLTGGLVAEEEWPVYEGIRAAVARLEAADGTPAPPVRSDHTNGLRFTAYEWTTNGTFRMELAYEIDTGVDIFAYAVACTSSLVVATWTNDENQVITDTNTVWTSVGLPFNGMESAWEQRGTVAISNGVAEFEDSGFSEELSRLRFYAAAVAEDTDGDGLNDGWEDFVSHTDPGNQDSDGDGVPDGLDTMPATSNVWFEVVTGNSIYFQLYLGTCQSNSPRWGLDEWVWNIVGEAPTSDSVVSNVWVSGHVDDIISVDGNDVDSEPGPTDYNNQPILDLMNHPESHEFQLRLWDHPATNHAGDNEVKLGNSLSDQFLVEWTWLVPMSVTGPECVCVGDTAQFEAGGAGGGPYTWSVSYEGATPVGEIDEDGVFTALAPGIATVTASTGRSYAVSQEVNVVQIDFLVGGGSSVAYELEIAKWNNAFTVSGLNAALRPNFINLDPDRFCVRVTDISHCGAGSVSLLLKTTGGDSNHNEKDRPLDLYETSAASGVFVSTNMILVSDEVDDVFSNSSVPTDNSRNDRTHRASPGGKVIVKYPETGPTKGSKEIGVYLFGSVHVIPIIMRGTVNGNPLSTVSQVVGVLEHARERFWQIGIDLTWSTPEICNPPAGMDLTDEFLVRTDPTNRVLTACARQLIATVGTAGNTNDIHLIFLANPMDGTLPLSGFSTFSSALDPIENDYLFNSFLNVTEFADTVYGGTIVAHELGHLLTNAGHDTINPWRLMYFHPWETSVTGTKRLTNAEGTTIKGDPHVEH